MVTKLSSRFGHHDESSPSGVEVRDERASRVVPRIWQNVTPPVVVVIGPNCVSMGMQLIERERREDKRILRFAFAKRDGFFANIVTITTDLADQVVSIELNASAHGIARWATGGEVVSCQSWESEDEMAAASITKKISTSLLKSSGAPEVAKDIYADTLTAMGSTKLKALVTDFCEAKQSPVVVEPRDFVVEHVKTPHSEDYVPAKIIDESPGLDIGRVPDDYLSSESKRLREAGISQKEFFSRLAHIVKKRLGERYGIDAIHLTATQIIRRASELNIAPSIRYTIDEILSLCERVIYANHQVTPGEMQQTEKLILGLATAIEEV